MTALLLAALAAADAGFDSSGWLADFHELEDELAGHDANFEEAVSTRRMDLSKLAADAEGQLRAAQSEAEARGVLQKFLRAFGDGHLRVDFAEPSSARPPDGGTLCERLERDAPPRRDGLPFAMLPNYRPVAGADSANFPAGLLTLDGGTLGVLRISIFEEVSYPGACAAGVAALHLDPRAKCDGDDCEDAVAHAAGNPLLRAVERQVSALERAGAQALLVDLTGNGGGSEWDDAVALTLSPRDLAQPRTLFVKHPHWTRELSRALDRVRLDLPDAGAREPLLRDAETRLEAELAQSKETCDRRPLWRDRPIRCTALAANGYTTGLLDRAPRVSIEGLRSKQDLFQPSVYDLHPRSNRLPLILAVDRGTGSAAERFAQVLADNGVARLIGELTAGAGCGYTAGGIPVTLSHSGGVVRMPDCVVLRPDGTNGNRGLIPDVLVPWGTQDSPWQRVEKLLRALGE